LVLLIVLGWAVRRLLRASLSALFGFGAPLGIDARRRQRFDPLYPLRNASPLVEKYLAQQVKLPCDAKKAFCCLVRETIPLPAEIISRVLASDAKGGPSPTANDLPPPDDDDADHHGSFKIVLAWAWRVDAPSSVEALSYLRELLERYYRSLWEGLSLPERVALYHLARRRIINVARAAPVMASLLRQGLIVLDPAPRLMNESFAAFVRQAEQSSTISAWAKNEALSTQSNSRLLLLVGAPALVVSVGLILFWTGTDPATILPIFVTGIPALFATLQKLRQQNAH
jgi:hypothetical protein